MRNIIVITPLRKEFDALIETLRPEDGATREQPIGKLPAFDFPSLGIMIALGGHGKVQFALHVQYLLERRQDVDLVVLAGVAGGLDEYLAVGDVVIASETIEHDYKERFDKLPSPRFPGDPILLAWLKENGAILGKGFRVHCGPIASGDEDVVSSDRAYELRSATETLAVAWEGAGGARACQFYGKPFLEIRGITDVANAAAPKDFSKNLNQTIKNVSAILLAIAKTGSPVAAIRS